MNLYALPYYCPHDKKGKWKVVDKDTGSTKQAGFDSHTDAKEYIRKILAGRKT